MTYTEEELKEFEKNTVKTLRSDDQQDHCWLWHGKHTELGYGIFITSVSYSAHQFSYFRYKGKLEDGLEIDHICEIRSYVNPNHLQAVTRSQNMKLIKSRQNVIQDLYNITNMEFDVVSKPLDHFQQCIRKLEGSVSNIGAEKFPDMLPEIIQKETILDMFETMFANMHVIFKNGGMTEERINGYKHKWFWILMYDLIDFGGVSFSDILEYYENDFLARGWNKKILSQRYYNLISYLEYNFPLSSEGVLIE